MDYINDSTSPLVQLVSAFEQTQRVCNYLHSTTYASDGRGSRTWSQWYDDVNDAVEIVAATELLLRAAIAKRIGATINL